ncbi:MAG: type II toxin-antitoxin system mRNA interferase toxin, RelE/StbE family [Elusimicrobia bacterium HGW-Elusimicrobia-1]|nr:MAG: type II toxin-antitoxin system mRNA interferase toxin, RelE/StbE family [Elusimicrobia bacterium HGW-Elusimicrobia-1]
MSYIVKIKKSAEKEIYALPANIHQKIAEAILKLGKDVRPVGGVKLQGGRDGYRLRVGDYRIIYTIDDKNKIVEISGVGHRKEVYR